ncbi:MAG: head-tail connector protein [Ruminococcus sp.]|nr:head-tail connector protein [Ruminococcus sp.]
MCVSDIDLNSLKKFCREDFDDQDDMLEDIILPSAKSFVISYTGLNETELDDHEDITIAVLVLSAEMYDERRYTVDSANLNPLVKSILDLHCNNLI